MDWYSRHFKNFSHTHTHKKNFPQCVVIHTVKGFSIDNEAEVDVFLEFLCFLYDPVNVGNLISASVQACTQEHRLCAIDCGPGCLIGFSLAGEGAEFSWSLRSRLQCADAVSAHSPRSWAACGRCFTPGTLVWSSGWKASPHDAPCEQVKPEEIKRRRKKKLDFVTQICWLEFWCQGLLLFSAWVQFPVLHCLWEFAQIHVHGVGDAIQPSYHQGNAALKCWVWNVFPSLFWKRLCRTGFISSLNVSRIYQWNCLFVYAI